MMKKLIIGLLTGWISFAVYGQDKQDTVQARAYYNHSVELLKEAKYDSALTYLQRVAAVYKITQDWKMYLRAQNKISEVFWRQNKLEPAKQTALQVIDFSIEKTGMDDLVVQRANGYYNLGITELYQSYLQQATETLHQGLQLLIPEQEDRYKRNKIKFYTALGVISFYQGYLRQTLAYYKKELDIIKNLYGENHFEAAISYSNIGMLYTTRGDLDLAMKYYKKALFILKKGDYKAHLATIYQNLGNLYFRKRQNNLSFEYYNQSLALKQQIYGENHIEIAKAYSDLGKIYDRKKQGKLSLTNYNKALKLFRKYHPNDKKHIGICILNIGLVYSGTLHNDSLALQYYETALQTFAENKEENGNHIELSRTYNNIGHLYFIQKNYDEAISFYKKSITIWSAILAKNTPQDSLSLKNPEIADSYSNIAMVFKEKKDYKESLAYIQRSLASNSYSFENHTDIYTNPTKLDYYQAKFLLESLLLKAQVLEKSYQTTREIKELEFALTTYQLTNRLITKMRKSRTKAEDKESLGESIQKVNEGGIRTAIQLYQYKPAPKYIEQAFYFSEKNKANILLGSVIDSEIQQYAGIPQNLLEKERNLRVDISFYEQKIALKDTREEGYRDSLFRLNRSYENLIETFKKDYPRYYELKYLDRTIPTTHLQTTLSPQQALIEYFIGHEASYAFVVTSDTTVFIPLTASQQLHKAVDEYYNVLQNMAPMKDFMRASRAAYQVLIHPLKPLIGDKKQLLIIPEGNLLTVPFEALLTEKTAKQTEKKEDFSALPYLIKEYQVQYHYSASLWGRTQKRPASVEKLTDFIGFAPYSEGQGGKFVARDKNIPLPESGEEVKGIYALFQKKDAFAKGYLATFATKSAFLEDAPRARIIHIASHSNPDFEEGRLSKIAFAGCLNPKEQDKECFLYAGEIYNIPLKANLVVLSSCESGVGRLIEGEGVFSLGRSFLYAGAKNVVFSLWEAYDLTTKDLMVHFYKAFLKKEEKSYARALQEAKLKIIKSDPELHPKDWSTFIVIGK